MRNEAKDLEMESSLSNIELESISSLKLTTENIVELKEKRDKLYLKLLNILISSSFRPRDYQVLDIYDNYKRIQTKYLNRRQVSLAKVQKEIRKNLEEICNFVDGKSRFRRLSSLSDLYRIQHIALGDWTKCFQVESDPPVDAFFIYVSEKVHTNLSIQVSRLYDFHEKAKVFLVFDDNTLESLLQEK